MSELADRFSSCSKRTPLVAFDGEGAQASILNYNLPASTAFVMRCFVPLELPPDWYVEKSEPGLAVPSASDALTHPPSWTVGSPENLKPSALGVIKELYATDALGRFKKKPDPEPYAEFEALGAVLNDLAARVPGLSRFAGRDLRAEAQAFDAARALSQSSSAPTLRFRPLVASDALVQPIAPLATRTPNELAYNPHELLAKMAVGQLPAVERRLYGREVVRYVSGRRLPHPKLFVIEDYEIASFLGDYGAGRTLKTFSLLPGEKTTISIKSWRTSETERSRGENVLDSFSQDSSEQFEKMADDELHTTEESKDSWATGWSQKDTDQTTKEGNVSAGFSVKIGPFGGGASGGYKTSTTSGSETNNSSSTNSLRANTSDSLKKAMDRHVNQSSSARKHDVNTETKETAKTTEGTEESVVRELVNINHSRVLNFVFRQLTQEYLTITHLKDVALGVTHGVLGDGQETKLDGINDLLATYIKPEHVAAARNYILEEMSNVYDYQGTRHSFIERVTEQYVPVDGQPGEQPRTVTYFRKDHNLKQSWRGKEVDGVILSVASRILVSDALIVEALLGQGEALDCYNMRLQDAADEKAEVANHLAQAGVDAVTAVNDPSERARAYGEVAYPPAASPVVTLKQSSEP